MIYSIIEALAATTKNSKKMEILKANKDNPLLKECFRLAYTKQIAFNIKAWEHPAEHKGTLSLDKALEYAVANLPTRIISGNDAREYVLSILGQLSVTDAKVFERVLKRDLECGCSASTANKVWPKLIPEQPCLLASSYSDKALKKIKYPAYAQLKSDGARGMADPVIEKINSRAGNSYLGLPEIEAIMKQVEDRGLVLDGELTYVEDLEGKIARGENLCETAESRQLGNGKMNKALKGTLTPDEAKNVVYVVWDAIPRDEYYGTTKAVTPYEKRFQTLSELVKELGNPRLQLIQNDVVHSEAEARIIYQKYIDMGLEGIILKNIDGVFEDKRSANLVKFKEVVPIDVEVIGVYAHRKEPNKLGGFTIRTADGLISNDTGSGLTDTTHRKVIHADGTEEWVYIPLDERGELDREYLWSIRDELIGTILECECNGWLTAKNIKDGDAPLSLFLPIIKKIRFDKNKANTMFEVWPDAEDKVNGIIKQS